MRQARSPRQVVVLVGLVVAALAVTIVSMAQSDPLGDHGCVMPGGASIFGIAMAEQSTLWPKVNGVYQVPYTIVSGGTTVSNEIAKFNSYFPGLIQWVPRSSEAAAFSVL
jgi:hypothetical protein